MQVVHPRWSDWTFLLYAGGLTSLGALASGLGYLSQAYGDAAYTALASAAFAGVAGVALLLRRAGGHPVAAGIAAFVAVWSFVGFGGALLVWLGWLDTASPAVGGFHGGRLLLESAVLVVALVALRLFRFPLLLSVVVVLSWLLVTDLLSNGGDWSAILTFLIGGVLLAAGQTVDRGDLRPYGFWLQLGAGIAIGGSVLWFLHSGDLEWAVVAGVGVLFVVLSVVLGRSSWAVLGTLGILLAATHFAVALTHFQLSLFGGAGRVQGRGWAPALVFGVTGILLMALGGAVARRTRGLRAAGEAHPPLA